ncbi:uncharacterized protein CLUP02_15174 [Colletotrichum lupini]|uniref:Uncharacterized protein n=1 Tax=Colletotrichum lupini TaxID=145971 RepID=A0A9Q8T670_9PEZI|nr:uncharacterized protein CLUP02_15174 [Colletotrichum lupini]UQC89643.1 hypothetical protein CLUP02_15174 [Colletotrichum lupini]
MAQTRHEPRSDSAGNCTSATPRKISEKEGCRAALELKSTVQLKFEFNRWQVKNAGTEGEEEEGLEPWDVEEEGEGEGTGRGGKERGASVEQGLGREEGRKATQIAGKKQARQAGRYGEQEQSRTSARAVGRVWVDLLLLPINPFLTITDADAHFLFPPSVKALFLGIHRYGQRADIFQFPSQPATGIWSNVCTECSLHRMYRDGTPYLRYHDIHPRARDTFDSDIRTPLPSSSSRPQGAKRNGHGNGNCKSQSTQGTPSCLALRCSDAPWTARERPSRHLLVKALASDKWMTPAAGPPLTTDHNGTERIPLWGEEGARHARVGTWEEAHTLSFLSPGTTMESTACTGSHKWPDSALLHSLFQPGYTTLWPYGCHVSVSRTRPSHPSHAPPFLATPCGSDPVPPVVTGSSGAQSNRVPCGFNLLPQRKARAKVPHVHLHLLLRTGTSYLCLDIVPRRLCLVMSCHAMPRHCHAFPIISLPAYTSFGHTVGTDNRHSDQCLFQIIEPTITALLMYLFFQRPELAKINWDVRDNINQQAEWRYQVCLFTPPAVAHATPLQASIRTNSVNPKVGGQENPTQPTDTIPFQWRPSLQLATSIRLPGPVAGFSQSSCGIGRIDATPESTWAGFTCQRTTTRSLGDMLKSFTAYLPTCPTEQLKIILCTYQNPTSMPAPPSVYRTTPPTYPSPFSAVYCHSPFLLRAWYLTPLRLGESEVNLVRHTMAKSRLTPPAPIILRPSKLKLLSRVLCVKSTWKSREPPGRNERRASSRLSKNGIRYKNKLTRGSSSHAWGYQHGDFGHSVAATCVSMALLKRGAGYLNLPASTNYWQKLIPAGISYHLGACPLPWLTGTHYFEDGTVTTARFRALNDPPKSKEPQPQSSYSVVSSWLRLLTFCLCACAPVSYDLLRYPILAACSPGRITLRLMVLTSRALSSDRQNVTNVRVTSETRSRQNPGEIIEGALMNRVLAPFSFREVFGLMKRKVGYDYIEPLPHGCPEYSSKSGMKDERVRPPPQRAV